MSPFFFFLSPYLQPHFTILHSFSTQNTPLTAFAFLLMLKLRAANQRVEFTFSQRWDTSCMKGFCLKLHLRSNGAQRKEKRVLSWSTAGLHRGFCLQGLLLTHLNVTVLCLSRLTADCLGLSPGFEDLTKWTGYWQACHTDPIWKDITATQVSKEKTTRQWWLAQC